MTNDSETASIADLTDTSGTADRMRQQDGRARAPGRLLHCTGRRIQPRLEGIHHDHGQEGQHRFIKSWDSNYMQNMLHSDGTYPNEYTRYYAGQLLEGQGEGSVDALTGATSSYNSFQKLSAAVVEQAKQGDSSIAIVDTSA